MKIFIIPDVTFARGILFTIFSKINFISILKIYLKKKYSFFIVIFSNFLSTLISLFYFIGDVKVTPWKAARGDSTRLCLTNFFSACKNCPTLYISIQFSNTTNIVRTTLKSLFFKTYYLLKPKFYERKLKKTFLPLKRCHLIVISWLLNWIRASVLSFWIKKTMKTYEALDEFYTSRFYVVHQKSYWSI